MHALPHLARQGMMYSEVRPPRRGTEERASSVLGSESSFVPCRRGDGSSQAVWSRAESGDEPPLSPAAIHLTCRWGNACSFNCSITHTYAQKEGSPLLSRRHRQTRWRGETSDERTPVPARRSLRVALPPLDRPSSFPPFERPGSAAVRKRATCCCLSPSE